MRMDAQDNLFLFLALHLAIIYIAQFKDDNGIKLIKRTNLI